jgi:hypothetical protein
MRVDVVFVNAPGQDVHEAISLLTRGLPLAQQTVDNRLWTAVTVAPSSGPALASALQRAMGKLALVLAVDDHVCTLAAFTRKGEVVGPADGSDLPAVEELVRPWRLINASGVASALTADTTPRERIRLVADAMKLPDPLVAVDAERPGLVVIQRDAGALRSRLPVAGHGAILVPLGAGRTAVVPDGSGLAPDPFSIAASAIASDGEPDPGILVSWGDRPTVESWGDTAVPVSADAGPQAVLESLGVTAVPVGSSTQALAAWATAQPGAVTVPAVPGGRPARLPVTDPERVATVFGQRRRLRRAQVALGLAAVAAGVGMATAWDELPLGWVAVFAGLVIVFGLLAAVVGRRRGATRARQLPERPGSRIPVAGGKRVGGRELPH